MTRAVDIPPDAVRVWRGFRAPTMALEQFLGLLGATFVPATVEMQWRIGLDSYVPTVTAGLPGKPDTVPDETAILFWDSQQTYTLGFDTLAVRTYTLTHGGVYGPGSGAQFPLLFSGQLAADQPYYLVPRPADWMHGDVRQALVGRPSSQAPDAFLAACSATVAALPALDAGVVCAGQDYLVFWGLGKAAGAAAEQLAALGEGGWSQTFAPQPTGLDAGLWDSWPGVTVQAGSSFNMQFTRRWETAADNGGQT